MITARRRKIARRPGGFTLIEVLISLAITIVIVIAMATLFDRSTRMTKVENSVTDAQQNVRYGMYELVRQIRMAGAGGLPANPDSTAALSTSRQFPVSLNLGSTGYGTGTTFFVNNVGSGGTDVVIGGSHYVRRGTDMIHIRGILDDPIYDLGGGNWVPSGGGSVSGGTLTIVNCSKYLDPLSPPAVAACGGYAANDMTFFLNLPAVWTDKIFVMKDSSGLIGAGLVTSAPTPTTGGGLTSAQLTLDMTNAYVQSLNPGGAFPAALTNPIRGGFLDDRVFFIDNGTSASATCGPTTANLIPGPCHPVLSMADWQSGDTTGAPYSTATVTQIAEDIEDLQVAYGIDFYNVQTNEGSWGSPASTVGTNAFPSDDSLSILDQSTFNQIVAGTLTDTSSVEDASAADKDEWIGNADGELGTGGAYTATFDETSDLSRLRSIEVSLLGKGSQPDTKFAGPGAKAWKLMDSQAVMVSAEDGFPYHRRVQTARINLRNFQFQ